MAFVEWAAIEGWQGSSMFLDFKSRGSIQGTENTANHRRLRSD